MPEESLIIRRADLTQAHDAMLYSAMLNAYALDPMGGGKAIPEARLQKVSNDLAELPHARCFLALLDGQAIGFATCLIGYSTFRAAPLWNIHDIAVIASQRGKGMGRALLQHISEAAMAEGACKLTLEVREDNPTAEGLYRDFGFHAAQFGALEVSYRFLEKGLNPPDQPHG